MPFNKTAQEQGDHLRLWVVIFPSDFFRYKLYNWKMLPTWDVSWWPQHVVSSNIDPSYIKMLIMDLIKRNAINILCRENLHRFFCLLCENGAIGEIKTNFSGFFPPSTHILMTMFFTSFLSCNVSLQVFIGNTHIYSSPFAMYLRRFCKKVVRYNLAGKNSWLPLVYFACDFAKCPPLP